MNADGRAAWWASVWFIRAVAWFSILNHSFEPQTATPLLQVVKRTFNPKDCYVNAGVYVVDLVQYKARNPAGLPPGGVQGWRACPT